MILFRITFKMHGSTKNHFCGNNWKRYWQYHTTKSEIVELRTTSSLSITSIPMTTLGLSTNTRLVGMAIIDNGELLDYFVRLHTSSWSPSKATQIITRLEPCVRQYSIKAVILSIPPAHCQTTEFKALTECIKAFFAQKNIRVISESSQILEVFCKERGRKTKKKIMRAIAEKFPELYVLYEREMRNRNKYYIKLFEAVGMATLYS
jgi:hypothetical protein